MDYYSILGIPRTASTDEIKKAYRKKAMQNHPDRGGDVEMFKRINEAYDTLKDPQKKTQYDNPHDPGYSFRSDNFQNGNPFAGSPFENMFRQPSHTPRNRDIVLEAVIELKDVLLGKVLVMQYRLQTGEIETVTVEVPPGAKTGDTINYQGLGDKGHPRIPRGDLKIRIRVKKHKIWTREDNNLIFKKHINVFDLMLGCVIIIQTLDNKSIRLTIPKGTKPGATFSISGYGIPDLHTKQRGNVYVKIEADIPSIEDDEIITQIQNIRNNLYTKG